MFVRIDSGHEGNIAGREGISVIARYPGALLLRVSDPSLLAGMPCEPFTDEQVFVNGRAIAVPEGIFATGGEPHTVVRLAGPVAPQWREELRRAGIELLFWAPPYGLVARVPAGVQLASLPFVAGAQPYREPDCTRGLEAVAEQRRTAVGLPEDIVDIVCFSREHRQRVETELAAAGIEVLASSSSKLRVRYQGDRAWLRNLVGVKLVDEARAPAFVNVLLDTIGLPTHLHGGPWLGDGQIVAVADSGLDTGDPANLHADFLGRVRAISSWPINPSWTPFVKRPQADDGAADSNTGHGTHVAGLAVGNGSLSGGNFRGVAPAAELVFQAIEQYTEIQSGYRTQMPNGYYLSGRPLDLRELFRQAREFGARIHVNAWGDTAAGQYTDDCWEADHFLFQNQDAVILYAAGNDGADRDGNGEIDRGSLLSPACAKNVVAVGATEGGEGGVGLRGSWSAFDRDGRRFPTSAEKADPVSGEPECMAMFSSTGPTADGRIKPDVCAPGTNLVAPRSSRTVSNGWGLASPMPHYMYMGGTSQATGVTGGALAVLRQAWAQKLGGRPPSGPALKALLVLGARPVRRHDASGVEPIMVAGFGRIDLSGSLPDQLSDGLRLYDITDPGLTTGERRTFPLRLPASANLTAVLCWYDTPGERLINDLDLALITPAGERIWGNHPPGQAGTADRSNTIERIQCSDLPAGNYLLEVFAGNVPEGPQPFALAVRYPEVRGVDIPIQWLKGIGPAYAVRLEHAGINTMAQLLALDETALYGMLGARSRAVTRLLARLGLLRTVSALTLPDPGIGELTLDLLGKSRPPSGFTTERWSSVRQQFLQLLELFDADKWQRIKLGDCLRPN